MIEEVLKEVKEKVRVKLGKEIIVSAKFKNDLPTRVVHSSYSDKIVYINPISIEYLERDYSKVKRCVYAILLTEYLRLIGFSDYEIVNYVRENESELIDYVKKVCRLKPLMHLL
jgi:hypothetical protein